MFPLRPGCRYSALTSPPVCGSELKFTEARLGIGPKADTEVRVLLHEPGCDLLTVEGDAHEKFAIPATLDYGPFAVGCVSGRLDVFLVRLREPEYHFTF
jgi:hypothetical protein